MADEKAIIHTMTATLDKVTKTAYRFIVDDNEYGISGALYVKQDSIKGDPPKKLGVKVRIKQ
jgi:hypothetical protein